MDGLFNILLVPGFRLILGQVPETAGIRLPVLTVKLSQRLRSDRLRVEATCIDTVAVRIRPWHVKRFDAAMAAKIVLRVACIERVTRQVIFARDQR